MTRRPSTLKDMKLISTTINCQNTNGSMQNQVNNYKKGFIAVIPTDVSTYYYFFFKTGTPFTLFWYVLRDVCLLTYHKQASWFNDWFKPKSARGMNDFGLKYMIPHNQVLTGLSKLIYYV
ncbi:hypothetical protein XENOCAPTIV_003938 [Xenoophorus captivus]|uniref:Uncharacterized protein n=1 Tax=Xenoophorus captivus TaxID=1517983 RepID=A0ABV0QYB2_9TELE